MTVSLQFQTGASLAVALNLIDPKRNSAEFLLLGWETRLVGACEECQMLVLMRPAVMKGGMLAYYTCISAGCSHYSAVLPALAPITAI